MTKEEYIDAKAPRWYVVLLRLYMGYHFLHLAVIRITSGDWRGSEMAAHYDKLKDAFAQIPWFSVYLEHVVDKIQGNDIFPLLLTAAPLLLGASLVFGLWCRLSTLLGVLYMLHLYFLNFNANLGTVMFYQLQIAVLAVLFLSCCGRTLGIDGLFWRNRVALRFEPVPPRSAAGHVQRIPPGPPAEPPEIPIESTGTIPLYGEEEEDTGTPQPAEEEHEAEAPGETPQEPSESDKPDSTA